MIRKTIIKPISLPDATQDRPRRVTLFVAARGTGASQVQLRYLRIGWAPAAGARGMEAAGLAEKLVDGALLRAATSEILTSLSEHAAEFANAEPQERDALTAEFTQSFRAQAAEFAALIAPQEVRTYLENEIQAGTRVLSLVVELDPGLQLENIPWELLHLGRGADSFFLSEKAFVVRVLVAKFTDDPRPRYGDRTAMAQPSLKPVVVLATTHVDDQDLRAALSRLRSQSWCEVRRVSTPHAVTHDLDGRGLVVLVAHHTEDGVAVGNAHWTSAYCRVNPFPEEAIVLLLVCRGADPNGAAGIHFLECRASLLTQVHALCHCTTLAPLALLPVQAASQVLGEVCSGLAGRDLPLWEAWLQVVTQRTSFFPIAFAALGQWDHKVRA